MNLEEAKVREASSVCETLDAASGLPPDQRPWLLWPFDLAPAALRALSTSVGDEDWILVVPAGECTPVWAEDGSSFGCSGVAMHRLPCGRGVLIGCHA